jgi:hypothetical protein
LLHAVDMEFESHLKFVRLLGKKENNSEGY